jgi:hypothetical protein
LVLGMSVIPLLAGQLLIALGWMEIDLGTSKAT